MRWFQITRRFLAAAVGTTLAVALLPGVQQAVLAAPAHGAGGAAPASAASDVAVSGLGDADGYHLYLARSSGQWMWQPLAVLAPGGDDGERWTGQQCVTGDGRTVVAVVAPWHAVNTAAGKDRGAVAVAVDLATGKARVLASGVALYYFNPGCGVGSYVTLTRYLGTGQEITQVLRVNAATGTVAQTQTVNAEVTSAVPVDGAIVAAEGTRLVRLAGNTATALTTLPQGAFDLRPDAANGVDLLTYSAAKATTAWRLAGGKLTRLSASTGGQVALVSGGAGRTVLAGSGLSIRPRLTGQVEGISLDGSVELVAPPKSARNAAELLPQLRDPSGLLVRAAAVAPKPATGPKAKAPTAVIAAVPVDRRAALGAASVPARDAALQKAAVPAATTAPGCAIPRDDLHIQVPQPSNEQINWAVQEAVINALPSRRGEFDNMPTAGYSPEKDFPQPTLNGTSTAGAHVPEVLVDAILAQESNWNQASWHAAPGLVGDPLIADYYGEGGDLTKPIDYTKSDCGYGLGQMTTIMRANAYDFSIQRQIAVDYAENVAAVVQLLATTWNQLQSDGITVNGANPNWLENWYDTIWAYNSGIEPNAANGNTTGCTPSPSCTDSIGNWGLGWANNPANPVYPANRPVFLSDSYADASHPGEWPYQELVFGWMATPLQRSENGNSGNAYVAAYGSNGGFLAQPPLAAFCSVAAGYNDCDPANGGCLIQAGPLAYHCWWHQPVTFASGCTTAPYTCTPAAMSETAGQPEPGATNPQPPTCSLDSSQVTPITGTVGPGNTLTLVTDEALPAQDPENSDVNLAGCAATPSNWSEGGTFSVSNVWDSSGNPLHGQSDFHQLGAGFGAHMWFTHMVASGDTQNTVTATWTPNLNTASGGNGVYAIYAYIPDIGATANAVYHVSTNYAGRAPFAATVDQSQASGWVDIGEYYLTPGASVSLSNAAAVASTNDLGIGAIAFNRVLKGGTKEWVALGDSYSSGEGADAEVGDPFEAGTDVPNVDMCHRSGFAYSLQALLGTTYSGVALTACSGDTSPQLTGGRFTEGDQLAALSSDTKLVTLTMGGNDLNFAGIMTDCVTKYVITGAFCGPDWPNLDTAIANETTVLENDYLAVHNAAPNAKIVVLTYPGIFPSGTVNDCSATWLSAQDAEWLYTELGKLDTAIRSAVATSAFAGVPVYVLDEQDAFTGHDVCSHTSSWVNQVNDAGLVQSGNPQVTQPFFHPTSDGWAVEGLDLSNFLSHNGLS